MSWKPVFSWNKRENGGSKSTRLYLIDKKEPISVRGITLSHRTVPDPSALFGHGISG